MTGLMLAMTAFVSSHLLMSHPLRPRLVAKLGKRGFLGLYSLVSAAMLVWVVIERRAVDSVPSLWIAPPWLWDVATLVMLFASILLIGSFSGNPAFPDPKAGDKPIGEARGVFAITRHPMMWSFILWALVHITLWGSVANLIVSVGVLILSVLGAAGQDSKKLRIEGDRWRQWMARTAFVPFAGQVSGRIGWRAATPGWGVIAGGLVLFLAATWWHPMAGGPVAGIWRWIG